MTGGVVRWVAGCALTACVAVSAALGATAAPAPSAPPHTPVTAAPPPPSGLRAAGRPPAAAVRGDNVLIQGKLYSPQAVFIVTRQTEAFGRDAIVPTYLQLAPATAHVPYRLREDRMRGAGSDTTATGTGR